jgi:rhamnosyltransferase
MEISAIIPTLNASRNFPDCIQNLNTQTYPPLEIIVIDSSSTDLTQQLALEKGCQLEVIPRAEFDHGGTRNKAASLARGDIAVFMTQDAVPDDQFFLERLIAPLLDGRASASYARQLPKANAFPPERFARLQNYPDHFEVRSLEDVPRLGVKAYYFSNVASAVLLKDFWEVGGFPEGVILSEDFTLAARLLHAGKRVAYAADARVRHSHNYSLAQQFRRYFDIGVFFARAPVELSGQRFGGEGVHFALAQLRFLWREHAYMWLPRTCLELGLRWLGFRLGRLEAFMPVRLKRLLSMHHGFWK